MAAWLGRVDRSIQRAGLFGRIRYIQPVRYADSTGTVRAVYDQILAEYGLGGPFFVLSVSAPLLAACWNLTRVSMLWGPLPRGQAELIAATVATEEACPFCVDVHTEMASAAGERNTAARLERRDWAGLARHTHDNDRLVLWVKALLTGEEIDFPLAPNLKPYAMSVTLLFVYITSLVTVFQREGLVSGSGGSRWVDKLVKFYMRTFLGLRVLRQHPLSTPTPGLADVAVNTPAVFDFAAADPSLAAAWGCFDKAVDDVSQSLVSSPSRQAVTRALMERGGAAPSLDIRFIDEVVGSTPEAEQGAVRLALLAGFAPFRVTEKDLQQSGSTGEHGERWVALVSMGVRARLIALAPRSAAPRASNAP